MSHPLDEPLGDIDVGQFREAARRLVDLTADYLGAQSYPEPILSQVAPGFVKENQPNAPPIQGISPSQALAEFESTLWPGLTHWNSPRFYAYFSISASVPGVLAEWLSAVLNQQAMLWRTSPVSTELESVTTDWLRQAMGLPEPYRGVIYDTASVSTLHALAAAREMVAPEVRLEGQGGRTFTVYCSEHTHSSIDKAVLLLGIGQRQLRKISCDEDLRMNPMALQRALREDRTSGFLPVAVVATAGTTSTATIDPIREIGEVCRQEKVWLHVDAAYGGAAALVPEVRPLFQGWEKADSIVFNPHKWLFTPFDCSVLFLKDMEPLLKAFSLTPEYLRNDQSDTTLNLMDTGIQLGRRFRSLKLWLLFRCFGLKGLRERVAYHLQCAEYFAGLIKDSEDFELALPVGLSLVCFRWKGQPNQAQMDLMKTINDGGQFFLSHTKVHDRLVLRCAIGHIRTRLEDLRLLFEALSVAVRS